MLMTDMMSLIKGIILEVAMKDFLRDICIQIASILIFVSIVVISFTVTNKFLSTQVW